MQAFKYFLVLDSSSTKLSNRDLVDNFLSPNF